MTNDDSDDEHDHPRWSPIPHPPPPCYLTSSTITFCCPLNDTLLKSLAFVCMFRFIAGENTAGWRDTRWPKISFETPAISPFRPQLASCTYTKAHIWPGLGETLSCMMAVSGWNWKVWFIIFATLVLDLHWIFSNDLHMMTSTTDDPQVQRVFKNDEMYFPLKIQHFPDPARHSHDDLKAAMPPTLPLRQLCQFSWNCCCNYTKPVFWLHRR